MSGYLTYTDTLTIIECGHCHIPFAIPHDMYLNRVKDGRLFYCPNGHNIGYTDTENKILKRQLAYAEGRAVHLADQLESEKRSKAALKGHMTRMRNRITNGVCPWCNRSFLNVRNHVHHMHPEHVEKMEEVTQTT
jgi:hypothetical protein